MVKKIHGTVHGTAIELDEAVGLRDGERVEVTVASLQTRSPAWGEGLKRCAGALAASWTEQDDRILEQIYRDRKADSRPEAR